MKYKRNIWGVNYLYLDNNTRIRFGFSLHYLRDCFLLQRKGKSWVTVSYTYYFTSLSFHDDIESILDYLKCREWKNKNM